MSDTVENKGRRDFIVVATNTMMAVGAAAVAYPLIDQMNQPLTRWHWPLSKLISLRWPKVRPSPSSGGASQCLSVTGLLTKFTGCRYKP